jgi:hypothetical protein
MFQTQDWRGFYGSGQDSNNLRFCRWSHPWQHFCFKEQWGLPPLLVNAIFTSSLLQGG